MSNNKREAINALKSNREFGFTFAGFFLLLAIQRLCSNSIRGSEIALSLAAFFAIATFVAPSMLAPLKRWWLRLGDLLHKITSPIIMALLFYVVITPMGMMLRLFGWDPLRLKYDPQAATYWISRSKQTSEQNSMTNQF